MEKINGAELREAIGEELLKGSDQIESDMPEGLRAWAEITEELERAEVQGCHVYVYRVSRMPGKKVASRYLGSIDFVPDEEALKNLYGGGNFRWRCEYYKPGSKKKILKWSPEIEIEGDPKIQNVNQAQAQPMGQAIGQAQATGILPNEKSLDDFERLLLLTERLSQVRGPGPQAPNMANDFKMFEFFQNQNRLMMEKMTEMIMRINSEKLDSMISPTESPQLTSGNEMEGIPILLRPFMPAITAWAEKMMMGGDVARQAARDALAKPEVKVMIDDPHTWNQLVTALVQKFGAEKVNAAMEVLAKEKTANP
jgi:hypothetical protein